VRGGGSREEPPPPRTRVSWESAEASSHLTTIRAVSIRMPSMPCASAGTAPLRREARAIAALNHPQIITVHSVEESGGFHLL